MCQEKVFRVFYLGIVQISSKSHSRAHHDVTSSKPTSVFMYESKILTVNSLSMQLLHAKYFQCCSDVCIENLTLCAHPTLCSLVQQTSRWRNSARWGAGEMGGVAPMRWVNEFCSPSTDKTCEQNLPSAHSISINFSFLCMLRWQTYSFHNFTSTQSNKQMLLHELSWWMDSIYRC